MADSPPRANTDTVVDTSTPPGMPRWVKVSGIITICLILLLVAAMAFSGGGHGPARHVPSSGPFDGGGDTSLTAFVTHQI